MYVKLHLSPCCCRSCSSCLSSALHCSFCLGSDLCRVRVCRAYCIAAFISAPACVHVCHSYYIVHIFCFGSNTCVVFTMSVMRIALYMIAFASVPTLVSCSSCVSSLPLSHAGLSSCPCCCRSCSSCLSRVLHCSFCFGFNLWSCLSSVNRITLYVAFASAPTLVSC